MPSFENKLLQSWIAPTLKSAGFSKTGATWHRPGPPFVHVFNIKGSQWSRCFYINLAVYISDIDHLERPKEYQCHFRERLNRVVPDRGRFNQLCDFEQYLPDEERRVEFTELIASYAIPWLDQFGTREDLRQYVLREYDRGLMVSGDAHHYLGIPIPEY